MIMAKYDMEYDDTDIIDDEYDEDIEDGDITTEYGETLGTRTFDEIVEYTLQSIVNKEVGLTNTNPGSVLRTLIEVLSENEDTCNYYIELVYKCLNIDNCVGEELDRAAKIFGLTREPAKAAIGELTLYTGDTPAEYDIEIPYEFIVSTRQNRNGEITEFYINDATCVLKAGQSSITVPIVCTTAGVVNVSAGAINTMSSSLQGIQYVLNEHAINGGRDTENDEDFLYRIKNVRQTFGKCTDEAIEAALNQISGVTRARVIDMYKGVATTGAIIVTDTVPAPQSVKNEVISVMNAVKASGIMPFIVYTNIKEADISINITNITEADYDTIVSVINKYALSLNPGQEFIIKQMERKILNAIDKTVAENDDIDIETIRPTSNITATTEQIIRLGETVIINGTPVSTGGGV